MLFSSLYTGLICGKGAYATSAGEVIDPPGYFPNIGVFAVFVTIRAMRFGQFFGPELRGPNASDGIRSHGDGFQVCWIDAARHAAQVIYDQPVRYFSLVAGIRNPVRLKSSPVAFTAEWDNAVSVRIVRPQPEPATASGFGGYPGKKYFERCKLWLGHVTLLGRIALGRYDASNIWRPVPLNSIKNMGCFA